MDEWVTTNEASKTYKVGLTQHRIAELARHNKIVARRISEKKWLVKLKRTNCAYELVKTVELEEIDQGSLIGTTKHVDWYRHYSDLARVTRPLSSNLFKIHNSQGDAKVLGDVIDGGFISSAAHPGPMLGVSDRDNPYRLEKTDSYLAQCLLSHLKAEFPEQFGGIEDWRQPSPPDISEDMMQELTLVSHRRTFEGRCAICECWEQ